MVFRLPYSFSTRLSIRCVETQTLTDFRFPTVPISEQLGLVVHELFAGLRGKFKIWPLNYGVHRAGLLAIAAVDAFGHVDIVAGCASRSVITWLGFDSDGLGWADGLTEFAGDTTFFSIWIPA